MSRGSVRITLSRTEILSILSAISLFEASAEMLNEGEDDPYRFRDDLAVLQSLAQRVAKLRQIHGDKPLRRKS